MISWGGKRALAKGECRNICRWHKWHPEAPPSGVQIWGAPPWKQKTPSPPQWARWTPPQKMGFSSVWETNPCLWSCIVLKKRFFKQFVEKKSRLAPNYFFCKCILSIQWILNSVPCGIVCGKFPFDMTPIGPKWGLWPQFSLSLSKKFCLRQAC